MTKADIARVQATWHTIEPVRRIAAELFYVKLFELDTTLKLLFSDDLQQRERKFLQLVDATVQGLDYTEAMMAAMRELGIRHPLFGDSEEHHGPVAAALSWMLEKCLRKEYTEEVRTSWARAFELLSQSM